MNPIADLDARTNAMMARYPVPVISTVDLSPNPTAHITTRPTLTKGLGVFALHDIPRGVRILDEPALLSVLDGDQEGCYYPRLVAAVKALPTEKFQEFCALHSSVGEAAQLREVREWLDDKFYGGGGGVDSALDPTTKTQDLALQSTFDTNAFHFKGPPAGSAVFPLNSRLNHSCVPNTCGAILIEEKPKNQNKNKNKVEEDDGATRPSDSERPLSPATISTINVAAAAANTIEDAEAAVEAIKIAAAARVNSARQEMPEEDVERKYAMQIRALRPIPAGTELTISYLGLDTAVYAERERKLGRQYGFVCDCGACVDGRGGSGGGGENQGGRSGSGKRKRESGSEESESDLRRERLGEILKELEQREKTARAKARGSGEEEEKRRALELVDEGWGLVEGEFGRQGGAAVVASVLAKQGIRIATSLYPYDFAAAFKWCKAWIINETICFGPGRGETDVAIEEWEGLVRMLVDTGADVFG